VNWLDHSKTLREQSVDPVETLLLRRKYFFSDQNVDARDPVQLNLLYVQVCKYSRCEGYSRCVGCSDHTTRTHIVTNIALLYIWCHYTTSVWRQLCRSKNRLSGGQQTRLIVRCQTSLRYSFLSPELLLNVGLVLQNITVKKIMIKCALDRNWTKNFLVTIVLIQFLMPYRCSNLCIWVNLMITPG